MLLAAQELSDHVVRFGWRTSGWLGERRLLCERQMSGIADAKRGVYADKVRTWSVDGDALRRLQGKGTRPTDITRELETSRASVRRHLTGFVIGRRTGNRDQAETH